MPIDSILNGLWLKNILK